MTFAIAYMLRRFVNCHYQFVIHSRYTCTVDRASVAPARPTNPSLVRELGFLIIRHSFHDTVKSSKPHLPVPRSFVVGGKLRLFRDKKYCEHDREISEY